MSVIDHVGLVVSHYEKSKAFYLTLLNPLGIMLLTEESGFAGFGKKDTPIPSFWIHEGEQLTSKLHVAFLAESKKQVHLFHEAGLMAGGKDNGKPG
ncbi:MAG: Glyoxalase/bleomycin resistance protein/dioxygenase [Gammaproteobacteria bacterium]|jgi:catechol 2,3-dioxygenase-like lactoylglutathione lyase family enzyme|nr:Glyoxalase/bleomycin resistance protein/dioxygenase [Gammaproteobacteria bacterium]